LTIEHPVKVRAADHRCDLAVAMYQIPGSAHLPGHGKAGRAVDTKVIAHMSSLYLEGYAYED
jgi:hypothetical protein